MYPTLAREPLGRRRLIVNTLANIGAQGVSSLVALVTLPLMLGAFGPVVYGTFLIASSVVGLAAVFDFGVGITTVREVAAHVGADGDDHDSLGETVTASAALYTAMGVIVATILFILGWYAGDIFKVDAPQVGLLRSMLWLYAGAQLVVWPFSAARHTLAGLQRYTSIMWVTVGTTLANALAVIYILMSGEGPLVLSAIYVTVSVVAAFATGLLARRALPSAAHPSVSVRDIRSSINPMRARQMVELGLPIFTIQIAAFIGRQQTDRLVLGVFVGVAAVALYEVAAKLGTLVAQLIDLAISAILPYVSGLEAAGDQERIKFAFLYGSRYIGLAVLPIVALLVAWAPQIVEVWVGDALGVNVGTSVVAMRLLVLSQVGAALYMVIDPIMVGKARLRGWATLAVSLAIVNLVLSVAVVGRYGIVGVAGATLFASLLEWPFYMRFISTHAGVTMREWAAHAVVPAGLVTVGVAAACWVISSAFSLTTLWSLGGSAVLVLGAAYGATALWVIDHKERAALKALLFPLGRGG